MKSVRGRPVKKLTFQQPVQVDSPDRNGGSTELPGGRDDRQSWSHEPDRQFDPGPPEQ